MHHVELLRGRDCGHVVHVVETLDISLVALGDLSPIWGTYRRGRNYQHLVVLVLQLVVQILVDLLLMLLNGLNLILVRLVYLRWRAVQRRLGA